MNGLSALQQYRKIGAQGAVLESNPHRLILMLIDGAIEKTAAGRGKMLHGEIAEKGRLISGSIAIIDALRNSLDHDAGGDLAENLDNLYEYMCQRLLESNTNDQPKLLEEVISLLKEVREAWAAIPQSYHDGSRVLAASAAMASGPR